MNTIRIVSVNLSEKKGTVKIPVDVIDIDHNGIVNDAHSGAWHRQVSLLGTESIGKMEAILKRKITGGEFAENITTEGYPLYRMKPLDRMVSGGVILEVTQIGKKCHGTNCAIYKETGDCVMPKEGIFCRVIETGMLKPGDHMQYHPKILNVGIATVSDRASRGEYEDKSGPLLKQLTTDYFVAREREINTSLSVVPDDQNQISAQVKKWIDEGYDLIFTTGGTGIGPRDVTPEAVKPLIQKDIPGIMELIRVKFGLQFHNALMSRGVAGSAGTTLIYTLPGSPKSVNEYAGEILPTVEHSIRMLHGIDDH